MRKKIVSGIGVLGVLLSFSLVEASWPGEKEIKKEEVKEVVKAQPERELRGYKNLNIAVDILKVKNFSELATITERILDLVSHYDVIDTETVLTATNAYLTALENVKNSGGLGFGAMLEEERIFSQAETKLEPLKQQLLGFFSISLMVSYVKAEEVFYSAGLLERLVASEELSVDTQRTLLNALFKFHTMAKKGVSPFLLRNVVKPILEHNEELRAEFSEKLGIDLVEMIKSQNQPQETKSNVVRMVPQKAIDLVESREGEVSEGDVEESQEEGRQERPAAQHFERPRVP